MDYGRSVHRFDGKNNTACSIIFFRQNDGTPDGSVDLALSLNYTFMSSVGAGTKDSPY